MFQHYTMTIPKDPGTPGSQTAVNDVVGIMSNGVVLDSHKQSWVYDNCGGHADKKGQYHYHIPAKCLLEALDLVEFDQAWWVNDDESEVRTYEEMHSQFPSKASPSPVVGFALDGFPIYALYDENGDLQRGKMYSAAADEDKLDDCNGKVDSTGKYGYYITPDPPFAPPCLRGNVGIFAYATSTKVCPKNGIKNDVFAADVPASCFSLATDEDAATAEKAEVTPFESVKGCGATPLSLEDAAPGPLAVISGAVAVGAALAAQQFM